MKTLHVDVHFCCSVLSPRNCCMLLALFLSSFPVVGNFHFRNPILVATVCWICIKQSIHAWVVLPLFSNKTMKEMRSENKKYSVRLWIRTINYWNCNEELQLNLTRLQALDWIINIQMLIKLLFSTYRAIFSVEGASELKFSSVWKNSSV